MSRKVALTALLSVCLALPPMVADAAPAHQPGSGGHTRFVAGAPGVGDPYFPLDGNGGYDVKHYLLDLDYDPATDVLSGTATITAARRRTCPASTSTSTASRCGRSRSTGDRPHWSRDGGELTVTPSAGLRNAHPLHDRGRPTTAFPRRSVTQFGVSGFMHTDDGAVVAGQPHGRRDVVPGQRPSERQGGVHLPAHRSRGPRGGRQRRAASEPNERAGGPRGRGTPRSRWRPTWPRWPWVSSTCAPTARTACGSGMRSTPTCSIPSCPRTGDQFAVSQVGRPVLQAAGPHDQRSGRRGDSCRSGSTGTRSPTGTSPSSRRTPSAQDDWTTLPDLNGHTSQDTGQLVPVLAVLHPFLEHYQADNGDGTCSPAGTSGAWWAATGTSDGYEHWAVDLSAYAGSDVEVSISYASDDVVQLSGVVRRRHHRLHRRRFHVVRGRWRHPGRLDGSRGTRRAARPTPTTGSSGPSPMPRPPSARSPTGRSPGRARSSTSCRTPSVGIRSRPLAGSWTTPTSSASPSRPRPVRSTRRASSRDPLSGDSVIVHELAHQWYGDSLAARAVAAHLAQRGLRHVRGVAVERA